MRELSLNILDIVQNSVSAGADLIEITIRESTVKNEMLIGIYDNGKGMSKETTAKVIDPFYTTRTTRKVGLGIPLFKLSSEQTGGSFKISSKVNIGTKIEATYKTDSLDFTPLGDMTSTVIALVTMNEDIDFIYTHSIDNKEFVFSTIEVKKLLDGVPLSEPEVTKWLGEYLKEHEFNLQ